MDLLSTLKAFCSVAEQGSLTRGSAVLGVAQSALSRQISALESEVGTRLFHRNGRGVVPTETGLRLLPRAKALVDESDALLQDLRGELASPLGTVDVGVVPAVRPLVGKLCLQLRETYPRIRVRAHEGFSGQVEEWVINGKVDVGLFNRYGRGAVRGAEALLRTRMVLIGRRGARVVKNESIAFKELAGVPLAIPVRPNAMLAMLEATAVRQRITLDFAFESGAESLIMDSVANAGMYTVVPEHVAARDYGAERFAWSLVTDPGVTQVTWMQQTAARPQNPAARIVANLVRSITPTLAHDAQPRLRRQVRD